MSQRLLNGIALGVVGLVAVGGIVVFSIEATKPPRPDNPPVGRYQSTDSSAAVATSPQPATSVDDPVLAAAVSPTPPQPPPRVYSWAEVEQELERLRAERATSKTACVKLDNWYLRLTHFSFTQSEGYPQHIEKLRAWRDQSPDSPAPLVALARSHIFYAWEARGSGLAFTVTDEGWDLFHQRIDEAHRLLEAALEKGVMDAEVYARLIDIAKAKSLPPETARGWFEDGRRVDPTYFSLYQAMTQYLLPRWHGEPGDIERFAAELAEAMPGDDGLVAYGWVVFETHHYEGLLFVAQFDRVLLGKSVVALAERFPNLLRVVNFAALATMAAQDHAAAKRIRPLLGAYRAEDRIWPTQDTYTTFMNWAQRETIPGGEQLWLSASLSAGKGLAFAPNDRFLWSADHFGATPLRLHDLDTQEVHEVVVGPGGVLNNFAFEGSKRWLAASFWNGPFQGWMLWDTDLLEIPTSRATAGMVRALAISPTAPRLAWAEEKTIRVLDVPKDEVIAEIELPGHVHGLRFSEDGKRLAVWINRHVLVDAESGQLLVNLAFDDERRWPNLSVREVLRVDQDGRIWATALVSTKEPHRFSLVRFTADGKSFTTLIADLGRLSKAALSPDGMVLAASVKVGAERNDFDGPTEIEIWNVESAQRRARLGGHWNTIDEIAFSADGKKLATAGHFADIIKIWSLKDSVP